MAVENLQVLASSDDARSYSDGGSYSHTGTTHYIGKIRVTWQQRDFYVGNRFNNVDIPQWATINSAILDMYNANAWEGTTVEMIIVAWDSDNTSTYSSSNTPADQVDTTATFTTSVSVATFETAEWFGNITWDIKSPIQEVIDRGSWASGNSLSINCRDNWSADNTNISISTYDRDTARWMKLDITYTTAGGVTHNAIFYWGWI